MSKKILFFFLLTQRVYPACSLEAERQLHAIVENVLKIRSLCIDLQSSVTIDRQYNDIEILGTMLSETKNLLNDLKNIVIEDNSKIHVGTPLVIALYDILEELLLQDFESQHPYIIDSTFSSAGTMINILYNLTIIFNLFPIEEESGWYIFPEKTIDNLKNPTDYFIKLYQYNYDYIDNMRDMFSDYTSLLSTNVLHEFVGAEKLFLETLKQKLINRLDTFYDAVDGYKFFHISIPIVYSLHNHIIAYFSDVSNQNIYIQNKIEHLFTTLMTVIHYYPFSEPKSWRYLGPYRDIQ
jgi:hypothetical protein